MKVIASNRCVIYFRNSTYKYHDGSLVPAHKVPFYAVFMNGKYIAHKTYKDIIACTKYLHGEKLYCYARKLDHIKCTHAAYALETDKKCRHYARKGNAIRAARTLIEAGKERPYHIYNTETGEVLKQYA